MCFDLKCNPEPLKFKQDADMLPYFDIDYRASAVESKKSKGGSPVEHCPSCEVKIVLARDPASIVVTNFLPALLIGIFILGA